jgi:hypothetical protein
VFWVVVTIVNFGVVAASFGDAWGKGRRQWDKAVGGSVTLSVCWIGLALPWLFAP